MLTSAMYSGCAYTSSSTTRSNSFPNCVTLTFVVLSVGSARLAPVRARSLRFVVTLVWAIATSGATDRTRALRAKHTEESVIRRTATLEKRQTGNATRGLGRVQGVDSNIAEPFSGTQ